MVAILGGHIDVTANFAAQALPQVRAGKMRMLAVLDEKRNPEFPDVPTAEELGYPVALDMWRGVAAPRGTPRPVIACRASRRVAHREASMPPASVSEIALPFQSSGAASAAARAT